MRTTILYVGSILYEGTCLQRKRALERRGYEVVTINSRPSFVNPSFTFFARVKRKLTMLHYQRRVNQQILQQLVALKDRKITLWLDKQLAVKASTLKTARKLCPDMRIVSYTPDDYKNPDNQSRHYLQCIPRYDLYVTTKSYNINELIADGARDVLFVNNAFAPEIHRPVVLSQEERKQYGCDVGFVGRYEDDRCQQMAFLADNGIDVLWHCPDVTQKSKIPGNIRVSTRYLSGDDYAKALCASKIALCFLTKANRDLQTQRSIEIPACGVFMLAERTEEHTALFQEPREAEFFASPAELLSKVEHYLKHESSRREIANGGLQRTFQSGYDNDSMVERVLLRLWGASPETNIGFTSKPF